MDKVKQLNENELSDSQKFFAHELEKAEQRVQDLKNTLSKLGIASKGNANNTAEALNQLASKASVKLTKDELYELGGDIMGSEAFGEWMQSYIPALGVRPIELIDDPSGIETLKIELLRIDYGLFS